MKREFEAFEAGVYVGIAVCAALIGIAAILRLPAGVGIAILAAALLVKPLVWAVQRYARDV